MQRPRADQRRWEQAAHDAAPEKHCREQHRVADLECGRWGGRMVRARIGQWARATLEQAVVGGFFGTSSFFGSPATAANHRLVSGALS